jgi:hypothetical protein
VLIQSGATLQTQANDGNIVIQSRRLQKVSDQKNAAVKDVLDIEVNNLRLYQEELVKHGAQISHIIEVAELHI